MLAHLNTGAAAALLYGQALDTLALIQLHGASGARELPPYDAAALQREMQLLPDWFCARHLALVLDEEERALLADTFGFLEREALRQPVVLVHRDYHSRNLMITAERSPGVIVFQDAVAGPVGYDLVSLLKDCYIAWPPERVRGWVLGYRERLQGAGMGVGADAAEFLRWFDLMGLQRHIKVLGIFARLYYRDGKRGYLKDLPRVLDYTRTTAAAHPETAEFADFLTTHIDPAFGAAQARVGESSATP